MFERLIEGSRDIPLTGCQIWKRAQRGNYGRISVNGKLESVHRVSYETFVAPIPLGRDVGHTCGIPTCIQPDHLRLA